MNNGYSRIRSKSIDFADPSQTAKQLPPEPKSTSKTHSSTQEQEQEDGDWEIFGVILERSRSVSSALPSTHKPEKQRALLLHSASIKRTFSMRRSSSMSGGYYCRIHHQSAGCIAENDENLQRRSVKRRGNILKACMRLLGL
nr:Flavin-dependent thymidylate synthase [Ipomoea batatas]